MHTSALHYLITLNSKSLQHKIRLSNCCSLSSTQGTHHFTLHLLSQFASRALRRGREQGTSDHTLRSSGRTDDTGDIDRSDSSVSPG